MENLEFIIELTGNTYSNYRSMELVLPIKFTKKTAKTTEMDANAITVNKFFEHWIMDIDIRLILEFYLQIRMLMFINF